MPLYEYQCKTCNEKFEKIGQFLLDFTDETLALTGNAGEQLFIGVQDIKDQAAETFRKKLH